MERCVPISINPNYTEVNDNDDVVIIKPKVERDIKINKPQICRLCLSEIIDHDYNKLEGITKNMLGIIIPELDTSLCNSSEICNTCDKTLKEIYNFKSSCLEIEDKLQDFVDPTSPAISTLEEIICQKELDENGIHSEIAQHQKMCRTCLNVVDKESCSKLYNFDGDPLKDMLEKCIPEMIINLTKEPVICSSCLESLEDQFNFLMQCLDSEEKINYYREKVKQNDNVDLYNVFLFSTQVEGEEPQNILGIKDDETQMSHDTLAEPETKIENKAEQEETVKNVVENNDSDKIIDVDNMDCEILSLSSDSESDDTDSLLSVTNIVDITEDKVEGNDGDKVSKARKSNDVFVNDQPNYKEDELSDEEEYRPFNKRRKSFKCPKCSYKAKYKIRLTNHLQSHHKTEEASLFKCSDPNCSFSTYDKKELKGHLRSNHPDLQSKPVTYSCPKCTETFVRKGNMDKHVVLCKKGQDKKEKTWRCNYGVKTSYRFNTQMLTMYQCRVCPYQTRMKANFDKHSLIHKKSNDIKVHKCKECSFETVKKDSFTQHMESHANQANDNKLRKCFLCSYETKRIDYFKKHMLVHKTEENIFG